MLTLNFSLDLSREEVAIAKRYPPITALCLRDGWELCKSDLAAGMKSLLRDVYITFHCGLMVHHCGFFVVVNVHNWKGDCFTKLAFSDQYFFLKSFSNQYYLFHTDVLNVFSHKVFVSIYVIAS